MVILSVDFGLARTGIAVCDPGELLASPVMVIAEKYIPALVEKVAALAAEKQAGQIVVGLPVNMDGSEGASAQNVRRFADDLARVSGLPVDLLDERCTTMEAHQFLNATNTRGKKRKAVVDAVSAVIILENYLDKRRAAARRQES
ncbi:MAG: Holliday junction resolvase RuvX [Clostridia bacterium]|nr:Holliday junction resolvase RuvX [Clostridia bacterium]